MQSDSSAPADFLIAIGSIAVSAGHIEASIRDIAQALIDDKGEIGTSLMRGADMATAERTIKALLPVRFPDDSELRERIHECIRQAREVMRRRNEVLHSRWMISGASATVLVKNDAVVDWPLDDLNHLAEDAYRTAVAISDAWFHLLYLWGHFDELEKATADDRRG